MASNLVPITVAHGDGIGPEIMAASLQIMKAAGARIQEETIEIGEKVYLRGINSGIEPSAWESLRRTKVFYKAPITTPQGGGYKSLNVTTRKTLGLYANVRPVSSAALIRQRIVGLKEFQTPMRRVHENYSSLPPRSMQYSSANDSAA